MAEIAPPPKAPERVQPPAPKPPEPQLSKKPEDVARRKAAHATLEKIAAGTPVAEALTPQAEQLPSHESMSALLAEANTILLDLKDLRLWVNAIATQAKDTPLGNEVRADALRNILTMESTSLPPEQATQLTGLQEKIKALNLPPATPETSALLTLMTSYNESHPASPIPADIVDAVKTGKREAAASVAQLLQTNNELAQIAWKDITGVDGFTKLTPSPTIMLDLAGIPKTPENLQKAQELFGVTATQAKDQGDFAQQAFMGMMYGALALQFFSQVALGEQGSGGGH